MNNIEIVKYCQQEFSFDLSSVIMASRTDKYLATLKQSDTVVVMPPPHRAEALSDAIVRRMTSDDCLSDVCLSVAYLGFN